MGGNEPRQSRTPSDRTIAIVFGVVFVCVMLAVVLAVPNPTPTQFFVFRVILALAASGIGAAIPGFLFVRAGKWLRAGGAMAMFALVFMVNPPNLIANSTPFSESMRLGEAALAGQNTDAALTFFERARQANSSDWAPYHALGRTEFRLRNYGRAATYFQQALDRQKDSKDGVVNYAKSMAEDGIGNPEDALKDLHAAASLMTAETPLSLAVLFDTGLMNVILWRKNGAPRDSQHYQDAELAFRTFAEGNGMPKEWAYYHLACLKATRATDPALSERAASSLRAEANQLLERSAQELSKEAGIGAAEERQTFRTLLTDPAAFHRSVGEPVSCPELVDSWKREHGSAADSLLASSQS